MKLPDLLTIPKVKRINVPGKFVFVDTETHAAKLSGAMVRHDLKLGHAIYWQRLTGKKAEKEQHYTFQNAMDFWEWALSKVNKRETLYIFAHNLTFDFLVLDGFRLLPCLDFTMTSIYYKFTTSVLRFANGSRRIVLADSMNFYPVKLADLARSVGMRKRSINFDTATDKQLAKYCKVDTEIVYRAIRQLVEHTDRHGLGSFKVTAPSMAFSIYRKSFMKHDIVTNHNPEIVAFEKAAYRGGVTQVNKLVQGGSPSLYKLDVNSMYPSQMKGNRYPVRLQEFAGPVSLKMLDRFLAGYMVIANVDLCARSPIYPYTDPQGTCYPLGEFTTTITTPLLKRALANDEIVQVNKIAVYTSAPIFDEYVTYMYGERHKAQMDNDLASALFHKTMNNSLYGKFGQKATESKVISDAPINEFAVYDAFDPAKNEHWREMHAGGSVVFIYDRGEGRYTSYAIASHITDYARLYLFDLARTAGSEHTFYMDTDALIVDQYGRKALADHLDPDALGALKEEDSGNVFIGFSKKDYILGASRKMKGYDQSGRKEQANIFHAMQQVGFFGAARKDLRGGAFWYEVRKRYAPYLRSVNVEDDGRVTPLRLPQEGYSIGAMRYTLAKIKGLTLTHLTDKQRQSVSSWITA